MGLGRHTVSWLAAFVAVAGCARNPTPRCDTPADCAGSDVCYRGFCIAGSTPDAGPTLDAASFLDARRTPDTGPTPDAFACTEGRTLCEAACVDLQTDHDHCGSCDRRCHPGMGSMSETCSHAECVRD